MSLGPGQWNVDGSDAPIPSSPSHNTPRAILLEFSFCSKEGIQ